MPTTIIKFTVGTTNNRYRLVCGDPTITGRNDVEKLGEDRTGKESWVAVGYNQIGMPSAETLLQLALMRVITTHEDLCIDKDERIVIDLGTLTGVKTAGAMPSIEGVFTEALGNLKRKEEAQAEMYRALERTHHQ